MKIMSHLNKLVGVAANRFLSSGDHTVNVTPPPALYKGVADSKKMSHTCTSETNNKYCYVNIK